MSEDAGTQTYFLLGHKISLEGPGWQRMVQRKLYESKDLSCLQGIVQADEDCDGMQRVEWN